LVIHFAKERVPKHMLVPSGGATLLNSGNTSCKFFYESFELVVIQFLNCIR
jgi:hypothetical protein